MELYLLCLAVVTVAGTALAKPAERTSLRYMPPGLPPPPPPPTLPSIDFWDLPGFLPHEFGRSSAANQPDIPLPADGEHFKAKDLLMWIEPFVYWTTFAAVSSVLQNIPQLQNEPSKLVEPSLGLQTTSINVDHAGIVSPPELYDSSDKLSGLIDQENENEKEHITETTSVSNFDSENEENGALNTEENYDENEEYEEPIEYKNNLESNNENNNDQSSQLEHIISQPDRSSIDEHKVDEIKILREITSDVKNDVDYSTLKNEDTKDYKQHQRNNMHEMSRPILKNIIDNKKIVNLIIFKSDASSTGQTTLEDGSTTFTINIKKSDILKNQDKIGENILISDKPKLQKILTQEETNGKTAYNLNTLLREDIDIIPVEVNQRTKESNENVNTSYLAENFAELKTNKVTVPTLIVADKDENKKEEIEKAELKEDMEVSKELETNSSAFVDINLEGAQNVEKSKLIKNNVDTDMTQSTSKADTASQTLKDKDNVNMPLSTLIQDNDAVTSNSETLSEEPPIIGKVNPNESINGNQKYVATKVVEEKPNIHSEATVSEKI